MPDDSELIKAGTEGLVEGTLKSVHELILRLFGPAADEAGAMLKGYVHHYRIRKDRFFDSTLQKLSRADIEPHPVPLKLLKPMIESGVLEDSDYLQDVWANMLANAAADDKTNAGVEPVFPVILKELGIQEVKFLNELYEEALRKRIKYAAQWPEFVKVGYPHFNIHDLRPSSAALAAWMMGDHRRVLFVARP